MNVSKRKTTESDLFIRKIKHAMSNHGIYRDVPKIKHKITKLIHDFTFNKHAEYLHIDHATITNQSKNKKHGKLSVIYKTDDICHGTKYNDRCILTINF